MGKWLKKTAGLKELLDSKKASRIAEYMYMVALVCYSLATFLNATMIKEHINTGLLFNIVEISGMLVILKIIFFDNWKPKELLILVLLGIIFWQACQTAYDFTLFYYFVLTLGAKNLDVKTLFKTSLVTISVALIVTILAAQLGFIDNLTFGRRGTATVRYALGVIYPTDLAARVFYLMLFYAVLKKFRLSITDYISYLAITVMVYTLTDTRLDALLMLLVIITGVLYKYIVKALIYINDKIIGSLIALFVFVNLLLAYFFVPTNPFFSLINKMLSWRLVYGNLAFKNYNVPLLGQFIPQTGNGGIHTGPFNYFFIDSSFIRVLMMHGFVAFVCVISLLLFLSHRFLSKKAYALEIALFFVVLSSAIDQHMLEISYNILFVAALADISYWVEDRQSLSGNVEKSVNE